MQIRSKASATKKEQQRAVSELLLKAAGLRTVHDPPESRTAGSSDAKAEQDAEPDQQPIPVPGYQDLIFTTPCHRGALRELAKVAMEGWGCEQDAQLALELFRQAAALGDPEAQGQMAVRYALGLQYPWTWDETGIVGFGQPSEEDAMLNYYFAASGGDALARMALGYRHMYGLGVPSSCWTAASYYQPVVEQTAELSVRGEGGSLPYVERTRLAVQFMQPHRSDRQREMVQFYQDSADKGNVDAQTTVGQVLNYGMHGMQRDHTVAMQYLQRAADAGDAQAMAHLGNMHANGLAGEVNLEAARKAFETAALEPGGANAQYSLGAMYLLGLGVEKNVDEALKLFTAAAEQGHVDAHYYLGVMHVHGLGMKRKNAQRGFTYLMLAAHAGHVLATYNVAVMQLTGRGTPRNCKHATALLKTAAERGPVAALLQLGHEQYYKGHYKAAVWQYLQAGEAGMETGQSNAAWLLSMDYLKADGLVTNVSFSMLKRSAEMGNVASLLSMGDAHFYGKGVPQDWARAAAIYYEAYQHRAPEAMFNLGFMHEFGAGVPQDLSLARRFYNMALHANKEATLPVYCARAWLLVHSAWLWLKPRLPAAYAHVWDSILVLKAPQTSPVFGAWGKLVAAALPHRSVLLLEVGVGQWMQDVGVSGLWAAVLEQKDDGETVLLAVLLLLLLAVLWARQQRQARAMHGGAPDAAAGAGMDAAAAGTAEEARPGDDRPTATQAAGLPGEAAHAGPTQVPPQAADLITPDNAERQAAAASSESQRHAAGSTHTADSEAEQLSRQRAGAGGGDMQRPGSDPLPAGAQQGGEGAQASADASSADQAGMGAPGSAGGSESSRAASAAGAAAAARAQRAAAMSAQPPQTS